MSEESKLIERVSELSDDDLLKIIYANPSQYRFETVVYAKAEVEKRGLVVGEAGIKQVVSASRAGSTSVLPLEILAWLTSRVVTFVTGFAGGIYLFILLNYRSIEQETLIHGFMNAGWPFQFYNYGGGFGATIIDWPYFLVDVLIALIMGISVGFIFTRIIGFIKSSIAE